MITLEKPVTYCGVKVCRVYANGIETGLEIRRYPNDKTWSVWLGLWDSDGFGPHREWTCLVRGLTKREARKWIEDWLSKRA